jgi:formylglycine-generating enzyme required for sulfatase activity
LPEDAPAPSEKHLTNSIGMQFVEIPPGRFVMGLPDEGAVAVEEVPAHVVEITRAYWLGVHEVTQEQYEKVSGANPSFMHKGGWGGWRLKTDDTRRRPVESVSWNDAVDFCLKLSDREEERQAGRYYRLPTEAEWEYACRGGLSVPYRCYRPDRTPDDDSGENGGGSEGHPRTDPLPIVEVGSYRPNRFGLYDMRGNVWEWCSDRYSRDYYATSPRENPQGSATGVLRVFRGADWVFCGNPCMINMNTAQPTVANWYVGFRVVCVETKSKSPGEASSADGKGATP